jgi:hypothetical protein
MPAIGSPGIGSQVPQTEAIIKRTNSNNKTVEKASEPCDAIFE